MNDAELVKVQADTQFEALNKAMNQLGYEELFEFHDNINLVEWKDSEYRYLRDFMNNKTTQFNADSPYLLESYINVKKTKKPTRQLAEEFDDIDLL